MSEADEQFATVVAAVRDRVTPTAAERERLDAAVADLVERAEAAVGDLPVDAAVIQVGSTARDTWLAGDRDIDLFVAFDSDLDREHLKQYGLQVGHAVLPEGREEYAEHPYVTGVHEGYDVDLVPCYAVEDATAIRSAVDRTPFHTRYLAKRLDADLTGDIRVAKAFCKGIGVYGSDLRTRGFSGVLIELLVLEYGGFRPLVEAAADWQPPVELDPEDHGAREAGASSRNDASDADLAFDDPLVVIDPTDPGRNVAAVCAAENVARLQHYARDLLADPRLSLFEPDDPEPLTPEGVREHLDRRGTTPIALRFEAPDVVEDQLWPQLKKSLSGVARELDRRGFDVIRSTILAGCGGEPAALLFELAVAERPAVERHEGPPVATREHAAGFYQTYASGDAYGPFVDGDRYVVERERAFRSAAAFCRSDRLFDVALGARVETALADREVLVGEAVAGLAAEFGTGLARHFAPKP